MIITISRQCGSGGHTIAIKVAEKLGIPCYDKEIIAEVSEKCNVSKEYAEEACELYRGGFINHALGYNNYTYPYSTPSLRDQINSTQVEVINELAEKGDCVIIGRGADYILRNRSDVVNVFIKAHMSYKIEQAKLKHDLNEKDAKNILLKRDKERSKHYYFYTGRTWGDIRNYDLVLDSGNLGIDLCVDLICEAAKKKVTL